MWPAQLRSRLAPRAPVSPADRPTHPCPPQNPCAAAHPGSGLHKKRWRARPPAAPLLPPTQESRHGPPAHGPAPPLPAFYQFFSPLRRMARVPGIIRVGIGSAWGGAHAAPRRRVSLAPGVRAAGGAAARGRSAPGGWPRAGAPAAGGALPPPRVAGCGRAEVRREREAWRVDSRASAWRVGHMAGRVRDWGYGRVNGSLQCEAGG
jgi:hypothetical protein